MKQITAGSFFSFAGLKKKLGVERDEDEMFRRSKKLRDESFMSCQSLKLSCELLCMNEPGGEGRAIWIGKQTELNGNIGRKAIESDVTS
jgi:hypothetical protein